MSKIIRGLKTTYVYAKYKAMYKNRLNMNWKNLIYGKLLVDIQGKSTVSIGKFLISQGPLYLKSIDGGNLKIGDNCFFNHNCSITCIEKVTIGNNCMFANNVVVVDHNHVQEDGKVSAKLTSKPVIIEEGVWIGANVTILAGVRIGTGAVIAAGAVVKSDVPAHCVAAGVPAKIVKSNHQ